MKKSKIIYISLILFGFFLNFVAIALLIVPFVTKNVNEKITTAGIIVYIFAFIFIGSGLITMIKLNDKR